MKYRGYHIKIAYSQEDGVYVGTIEGIHDVISCHGSSKADCKYNAQVMVDEYINTCMEFGKEPEIPLRISKIRLFEYFKRRESEDDAGE